MVEVLLQDDGVDDSIEPSGPLENAGVPDGISLEEGRGFIERWYCPWNNLLLIEGHHCLTPEGNNFLMIERDHVLMVDRHDVIVPEGNDLLLIDGVDMLVIDRCHFGSIKGLDVVVIDGNNVGLPEGDDVFMVGGFDVFLIEGEDRLVIEVLNVVLEILEQGDDLDFEIFQEAWTSWNGFASLGRVSLSCETNDFFQRSIALERITLSRPEKSNGGERSNVESRSDRRIPVDVDFRDVHLPLQSIGDLFPDGRQALAMSAPGGVEFD